MDLSIGTKDTGVSEFLAVLLAGFGKELVPLTSDNSDEASPKALLPIANKPLIDYMLAWIEHSSVKDVMIICPSIHRHAISHHIHSNISPAFASLRIDIQTYEETQDSPGGTCTLLRHFATRILQDFIVLPCDFIPPSSLHLSTILNKFRSDSFSDTSVATTCWFPAGSQDKGVFPDEWSPVSSSAIVWDKMTGSLLHVDTLDEQDRNSDAFELPMTLLTQYNIPRSQMSRKLQDSHVYVCRRSVLDLLQEKRHFDSFREDFMPWLCSLQHRASKREKYTSVLNRITNVTSQSVALAHSGLYRKKGKGDASLTSEITARVNTLDSFMSANRYFLSKSTYSLPTDPKDRALIDQKAQISADTMVDVSTQISERTTIKKSVIGKHCIIGKMVRIVGCVLLDHCVVEDGAKLDGCILGTNTKIGAKAELTRCVTQAGYEVATGETVKNERLEISDWTAGGEDSEEESDDE
ncbi:UDP-3-O-glucosamine N-acyltransferase [Mycena floridula]|nr:UDP-3-O-glucosamine N-acyltransferase [Mycena floridula]